jgi:hypothetical protein
MHVARKMAIWFVSIALVSLLVALPALVAINQAIGKPDTIKKWLQESQLYNRAVDAVIEQADKAINKEGSQPGQEFPFSRPEVKAAAAQAFSPNFLQTSTENVVDGTYNWLKGKTPKPDFAIRIGDAKQQFAAAINKAAKDYYASLPMCPPGQAPPADLDPFAVTCQIRGFNAGAEIDRMTSEIVNNKDFLDKDVITADDIKTEKESQQPVYTHLAFLPVLYRLNQIGVWVLGMLALGAAIGLIFIYPDRRRGLRRVAAKLIGVGAVVLLGALIIHFAFGALNKKFLPHEQTATAKVQESGLYIAKQAEQGIIRTNLWFGIGYVLLGISSLAAIKFWLKPPHQTAVHSPTDTPKTSDRPPSSQLS